MDHLFSLFEQIVSYFEVLFVYLKKQLNQGVRDAILTLLFISYFFFLLFAGSSFLLYSAYLTILSFTNENPILSSFMLGFVLVFLSILSIRYFLRRISL
ncbi:MAG: hypothetical protein N3A69_02645 [Leptospiraceae bacterium]|nr:hypothetical protein [Leptospiraceae bacterium]